MINPRSAMRILFRRRPDKAREQMEFLGRWLKLPRGARTDERWAIDLAVEIQRRLDAKLPMPPKCPGHLR